MSIETENRIKIECPNCGAVYAYPYEKLESQLSVHCQNCGKKLEFEREELEAYPRVTVSDEHEKYIPWSKRREIEDESSKTGIPRLLLHGFAFWVVFGPASLIWIPLILIAAAFGGIIGLILLLLAQLVFAGFINLGLGRYLWEIHCKDDWVNLLAHGFVLLLVLDAIMLVVFVINAAAIRGNFALFVFLQLLQLIVLAPIYGYVGRWIALQFEIDTEEDSLEQIDTSRRATCPNCGATYSYDESVVDSKGNVGCQNCGEDFAFLKEPVPSSSEDELS